jgi:hypothetical protein
MASVYRRPKTKYWFAGWYDSNGKFHLRSTKKTDRRHAMTVALAWERAEKLARDRLLTETAARNILDPPEEVVFPLELFDVVARFVHDPQDPATCCRFGRAYLIEREPTLRLLETVTAYVSKPPGEWSNERVLVEWLGEHRALVQSLKRSRTTCDPIKSPASWFLSFGDSTTPQLSFCRVRW